jgi:hypothetical protein
LHEKFSAALSGENPEQITDALTQFAADLQNDVVNDCKAYQQSQDSSILARRGVRQLTAQEKKFYTDMTVALKSHYDSPKMAFTGLDNTTLPQTVLDQVLSDIQSSFPILRAINFQNTAAIAKMVVNKQGCSLRLGARSILLLPRRLAVLLARLTSR